MTENKNQRPILIASFSACFAAARCKIGKNAAGVSPAIWATVQDASSWCEHLPPNDGARACQKLQTILAHLAMVAQKPHFWRARKSLIRRVETSASTRAWAHIQPTECALVSG